MRLRIDPESGISGIVSIGGNCFRGDVGGVERVSELAADGGASFTESLRRADSEGEGGISSGSARGGSFALCEK
jgi:hypothetical protein